MTKAEVKPKRIKKSKAKASVSVTRKPKKKTKKPAETKLKRHTLGRPLKFQTVKDLKQAINDYFESLFEPRFDMWGNPVINKATGKQMMKKSKVATVTGLAVALGTTRETLLDYELGKHDGKDLTVEQLAENEQIEDFSDTIKEAKLRIYSDTEQQLYQGKAVGAIFSLKNNYGWVDKTVTETTPTAPVNPYENLTEDELRKLAGGGNG